MDLKILDVDGMPIDREALGYALAHAAIGPLLVVQKLSWLTSNNNSSIPYEQHQRVYRRFGMLQDCPRWMNDDLIMPMSNYSWSIAVEEHARPVWQYAPGPLTLFSNELAGKEVIIPNPITSASSVLEQNDYRFRTGGLVAKTATIDILFGSDAAERLNGPLPIARRTYRVGAD